MISLVSAQLIHSAGQINPPKIPPHLERVTAPPPLHPKGLATKNHDTMVTGIVERKECLMNGHGPVQVKPQLLATISVTELNRSDFGHSVPESDGQYSLSERIYRSK